MTATRVVHTRVLGISMVPLVFYFDRMVFVSHSRGNLMGLENVSTSRLVGWVVELH